MQTITFAQPKKVFFGSDGIHNVVSISKWLRQDGSTHYSVITMDQVILGTDPIQFQAIPSSAEDSTRIDYIEL